MAEAKMKDLLKCKNRSQVLAFAKKNGLSVSNEGNNIQVGNWSCIMNGDKFLYVR